MSHVNKLTTETLAKSDQYRSAIDKMTSVKTSEHTVERSSSIPGVNPSSLSPKYRAIYYYATGFLKGSSYSGNSVCSDTLNGLAYYSLKMV